MHRLALELVLTAKRTPEEFASFQRHIPVELILQALAETGTATIRRRRLPAQQVIWLIIGIRIEAPVSRPGEDWPSMGWTGPACESPIAQKTESTSAEPTVDAGRADIRWSAWSRSWRCGLTCWRE